MMSDILRLTDEPLIDVSIESYEWQQYNPISGSQINTPSNITIIIESQSIYCHPAESYLLFEGRLTKADNLNTAYANDDAVTLTNNGLMHLFQQISYRMSNQEIETISNPGQATTMFGLLKYPNDFQLAQGLNQLWYKDSGRTAVIDDNQGFAIRQSYLIQKPGVKGTFSFIVPLKHIFGFCDDYNKVIYGVRHELILGRKADDDAIFRDAAAAAGKVVLDKISWFMPHVIPSLMEDHQLNKTIASKATFLVGYRARQCDVTVVHPSTSFEWKLGVKSSPEQPRYVIIGFQTNRDGNQERNPSIFDHCNLTNMYVMMNTARYPAVDYYLSFPNQQFSRAYRAAATFSEKFYGMDEKLTQSNITPVDFKELYPIMVFDMSRQPERLKSSAVDIQIRGTFSVAPPVGTKAYAVQIYDKLFNFQSDGDKIGRIY